LEPPPPDSSHADSESESRLLLANITFALRALDRLGNEPDGAAATRVLEEAVHTYGSIKHLLAKLDLKPEQRTHLEAQLRILRERIMT